MNLSLDECPVALFKLLLDRADFLVVSTITIVVEYTPLVHTLSLKEFDVQNFCILPNAECIRKFGNNIVDKFPCSLLFYFESLEQIQVRINAFCSMDIDKFVINPTSFEFWIGHEDRLHKRYFYQKSRDELWKGDYLYP